MAVFAGGVVRAAVADHEDDVFALPELLERDRHCAADPAGEHDRLVVADVACGRLHRRIRLGLAVGDLKFNLLAEDALAFFQGRNLLGYAAAVVEVIHRQFEAELHVPSRR